MTLLTAKPELLTPEDVDFVHVVDVSDTSSDPAGSSRKAAVGNLRGGLKKRGVVSSDLNPAQEGAYIVDGVSAPFNFNLPAATGSQARVMISAKNVETNNVTLKVPAGEVLNNVTNGTVTIGANGELFLCVDRDTGVWDAKAIGESKGTTYLDMPFDAYRPVAVTDDFPVFLTRFSVLDVPNTPLPFCETQDQADQIAQIYLFKVFTRFSGLENDNGYETFQNATHIDFLKTQGVLVNSIKCVANDLADHAAAPSSTSEGFYMVCGSDGVGTFYAFKAWLRDSGGANGMATISYNNVRDSVSSFGSGDNGGGTGPKTTKFTSDLVATGAMIATLFIPLRYNYTR